MAMAMRFHSCDNETNFSSLVITDPSVSMMCIGLLIYGIQTKFWYCERGTNYTTMLPQFYADNCTHISTSVQIDRRIRLSYSALNPAHVIEQTPLVDQENLEAELRFINPGRWTVWNILKRAEEVGFLCWNGRRQKIENIQFVDKVGDTTVAVDRARVSDLLERYKSIVGLIRITRGYKPRSGWYIDVGLKGFDSHAAVVFGEYVVSSDDGPPKGVYWVVQDSGALGPDNPFGILFVSATLLIEAYTCTSVVQPVLLPLNFDFERPYPVIAAAEA